MTTINCRRIFALAFAFFVLLTAGSMANAVPERPMSSSQIKPSGHTDVAKLMEQGPLDDMVEGDANAPVTIVEYASLSCSHCADFYQNTLPQIREKYIKSGKVRWVFREFSFDPKATVGFMLARCVAKDRYFPFIEMLFRQQQAWLFAEDALTQFKRIAALGGLDGQEVEACLNNQMLLEGINAASKKGALLGVEAIPTFFVNGDRYEGALPVEEISQIIDSHLQ